MEDEILNPRETARCIAGDKCQSGSDSGARS